MKFSRILVLYLSVMAAPSALAIPLRHVDRCSLDGTGVRCIGQKDDHGRTSNPSLNGANLSCELQRRHTPMHLTPDPHFAGSTAFQERGLSQTLGSILEGLPLVGPILGPILKSVLGIIGLSEMDVASASTSSLDAEQIAMLANFEFALSNAAHKVLLPDGNPAIGAQSKLKVRAVVPSVVPLGQLTTAVPIIGPFLQPLLPLLQALDLEYVDAKPGSVFSLALLNQDQSAKLSLFQTILRQEVDKFLPNANNSTPPDAPSPNDVIPPPTPESSQGAPENGSDAPSPDGTSPVNTPDSGTLLSSPAPK